MLGLSMIFGKKPTITFQKHIQQPCGKREGNEEKLQSFPLSRTAKPAQAHPKNVAKHGVGKHPQRGRFATHGVGETQEAERDGGARNGEKKVARVIAAHKTGTNMGETKSQRIKRGDACYEG